MNKHLIHIALNVFRTVISPVFLFLVSYLVVQSNSKALWGEFVVLLFTINFSVHILNWGSSNYLLRKFSSNPASISVEYYSSLFTRSIFLSIFFLIYFILFDLDKAILLFTWLIGAHIIKSIDPIITYSKKYIGQLVIEISSIIIAGGYLLQKDSITVLTLLQIFTIVIFLKSIAYVLTYSPRHVKFQFNILSLKESIPFFIIGFSGLLQTKIDTYVIAAFADKEIVGTYQIFFSFFMLLQIVSGAIILTYSKALYRVSMDVFQKTLKKSAGLGALVSIAGSLFIYYILTQFFQLKIPTPYYCIGALFSFPPFIYSFIIMLFYRLKKEREILLINYAGIIINGFITYLFVMNNNAYYAIVSTAVIQWLMLGYYWIRKDKVLNKIQEELKK